MIHNDDTPAPLAAHLGELRTRVLWMLAVWFLAGVVCYLNASTILDWLLQPLAAVWQDQPGRRLIYTGLTEGFILYWRIGIYGGLILAFPVLAWHLWRFIVPGLYRYERRFARACFVVGPALFALGALMVYVIVLPLAWRFFLSFEQTAATSLIPLYFEPRVEAYVTLVLKLMVVFGVCFQLPLVLVVLAHLGFVQSTMLTRYRRHAIVAIFAVAAVVTPPDIFSQIILALPLIALYEIAILAVRLSGAPK